MSAKNNYNNIQAIVLAAGRSNRFGTDKTQIQINSIPMAIYICQIISNITPNVLIIINANNSLLIKTATEYKIKHLIITDDKNTGIGHTISNAVKHSQQANGWLFCLGDMPLIKPHTYKRILDNANSASTDSIVMPVYNNKTGHPVYFGKDHYSDLSKLTGDTGAKSIIKEHSTVLTKIITTDKFIHQDIDTTQDLKELKHLLKNLS